MKDIRRQVSLQCPTCGKTDFQFDEAAGPSGIVTCASCGIADARGAVVKVSNGSISAGHEAAWDGHKTLKRMVTYAWNLQYPRKVLFVTWLVLAVGATRTAASLKLGSCRVGYLALFCARRLRVAIASSTVSSSTAKSGSDAPRPLSHARSSRTSRRRTPRSTLLISL